MPQFSFPEGISSNNVKRVTTDIEMNQIVFSPLSSVEESDSSFVFLLTAEDALLYGVCVVHEELLRVCDWLFPILFSAHVGIFVQEGN